MLHSAQDDKNSVEAIEPGFASPKQSSTTWIHRFTYSERLLHWTNAVSYFLLAITGLAMFIRPWEQAVDGVLTQLFGQSLRLEQVHILAAIIFVVGPILWLITGHRALWADARNILRFDKDDRTWLARALSIPRRVLPPPGRFNAGQKLNSIIMVIAWGGFLVTGLLIMHWPPFGGGGPVPAAFNGTAQHATFQQGTPGVGPGFGANQSGQTFSPADGGGPGGPGGDFAGRGGPDSGGPGSEGLMRLLHEVFALISITLVAGHIYMATLNPSTKHSLRGMWGGFVKRDWAREHHVKWVEEEESKPQKA